MKPVTQVHSGATTGAKTPIPLDYLSESGITAAYTEVSPTVATATVEVTLDNVFDPDAADYVAPASARWFTLKGFAATPITATEYVTFSGPWRAIRLNIATNDGTVIFQVGQGTSTG